MLYAHRRYLILEQGIGAVIVNFFINATIAWLLFRSLEVVPLWGPQSIAGDTVATTFLLPFITCLIVTRLAHRAVDGGRFPAPEWRRASHPALGRLPRSTPLRALAFGFVCMITVAPASIWVLQILGLVQLGFWSFVLFKALFAGALAAPVTPIIGLCALGDSGETR
jgi:hypothetical protein